MTEPTIGVCGFPRCGSSMLMRMLHVGGLPPVDGSASRSYELGGGFQHLAGINPERLWGRAIKLLDYPLWFEDWPQCIDWRFIWSDRDHHEQARSTIKFLAGIGQIQMSRGEWRRIARSYPRDRPRAMKALRDRGDVLTVRYDQILADPDKQAARIGEWVLQAYPGGTFDVDAAARVVHSRSPRCAPDLAFEAAGLDVEVLA